MGFFVVVFVVVFGVVFFVVVFVVVFLVILSVIWRRGVSVVEVIVLRVVVDAVEVSLIEDLFQDVVGGDVIEGRLEGIFFVGSRRSWRAWEVSR